nr:uncharacterized protein LOC111987578 [Quercus suber]
MTRVMLLNKQILQKFWGEAMNTLCHIGNRIFFRAGTKKTTYEIWNGKKPRVKYFQVFRSKCYILNDRENLGKFDAKSDEGIFLGYSTTSRAYRVFNKRTKRVMESINVEIDDAITKVEMVDDGEGPSTKEPTVEVEALDIEVEGPTMEKESTPMNSRMETRSMSRTSSHLTPLKVHPPIFRHDEVSTSKKPSSRVIKNHPDSNIIGSFDEASRLDIAFSIGVCARYQAAPKESRLIAVKQIIRYINGTPDYGLWYSKDSNACFAGYSDAD